MPSCPASALSDDLAEEFSTSGLVVIRGVLEPDELAWLQHETDLLVVDAIERPDATDARYREHPTTGRRVPFRVEYVIDKSKAVRSLVAHPVLLRLMSELAGPAPVVSFDSMVFKVPGEGATVDWHRDIEMSRAGWERNGLGHVINIDVYLDRADESTCVWGIPGSNRWDDETARRRVAELSDGGFCTEGAVPIAMEPGDVLVHDTLVLHGSPPSMSDLRRVVYFGVHPREAELRFGPHDAEFVALRERVLPAAIAWRAGGGHLAGAAVEFRTEHERHWVWDTNIET